MILRYSSAHSAKKNRIIIPEVAGLCYLGQQVSDHVDELLLGYSLTIFTASAMMSPVVAL